jgi:hypothetical protein
MAHFDVIIKALREPAPFTAYVSGLPDGFFQTKNRYLSKFLRVLQRKMLVYFLDIWSILQSFYIFWDHICYIL